MVATAGGDSPRLDEVVFFDWRARLAAWAHSIYECDSHRRENKVALGKVQRERRDFGDGRGQLIYTWLTCLNQAQFFSWLRLQN